MIPSRRKLFQDGDVASNLDLNFANVPAIPSSLSFTRNVTASVVDFEGLVKTAKANEVRFPGARRVENLASNSQDLTGAAWTLHDATRAATTLTFSGAAGSGIHNRKDGLNTKGYFVCSFEAWVDSGTKSVRFELLDVSDGSDAVGVTLTLTTTRTKYSFINNLTASSTFGGSLAFYVGRTTTTAAGTINLTNLMIEDAVGQTNQNPSEYISVGVLSAPWHGAGVDGVQYFTTANGNTVASNVVTEVAGVPLTNTITLLAEEARTNLAIQSQTISASGFSAVNCGITDNVATSPAGVPTSASVLIPPGVGRSALYKSFTASAEPYTLSVYIKNAPSSFTWAYIRLYNGAADLGAWFNLATGVKGTVQANTTATITDSGNGWYRCTVTATLVAGSSICQRALELTDSDNTKSVTGNGVKGTYFWGLQLEAASNASSYIPTTTAAVTRTVDAASFTGAGLNWYNAQQGTFAITASGQYSSAPGNIGVWNQLLTGSGSYAITYNKNVDTSAYLYLPNAQAGVNPVKYQNIPTPITILLGEQGILNLSKFTYYPKAIKSNKVLSLVTGTLTTAFDTSYADLSWDAVGNTYSRTSGTAATPIVTATHTNMKRCLLRDDRTVNYYLNPTNSALKADGSASVLTGADGMVMVEIPKFYVKYSHVGNVHNWAISAIPQVGYTVHPAFILDGVEVDYRYMGAYDACVWTTGTTYQSGLNYDDNVGSGLNWDTATAKLASVSGIYPAVGINRAETRTLAANRGTTWRQTDYELHAAVQLLYLIEYGSFDSQTKIGAGNTAVALGYPAPSNAQTDSPHSVAGKSNSIGNATGAAASTLRDTAWMSYRGIENLYGNCWSWVDGINVNNNAAYIITSNIRSNLADDTATNYTSVGTLANTSGYQTNLLATGTAFLPISVGEDYYITDNYYQTAGWAAALVSGRASYGTSAGVFYFNSSFGFGFVDRGIGARLVC